MNTLPDKIYFPEDGLPAYIDWDGSPVSTKPAGDNPICYIRKDTLLEWLQQGFDWIKNPVISVQQILDKLNSM